MSTTITSASAAPAYVTTSMAPTPNSRLAIEAGGELRGQRADDEGGASQHQRFAEDVAEHVDPARAERDANAELAGPLGDDIRHHAGNACCSEQHGEAAEPGEQRQHEAAHADCRGRVDGVLHGAHIGPDVRRIHRDQMPSQAGDEAAGVMRRPCTDQQVHVVFDKLRERSIDGHRRRVLEARLAHVGDDADNLAPHALDRAGRAATKVRRTLLP